MTTYEESVGLVADELERWVRRLRSLSTHALETRRAAIVATLQELAVLGASAERIAPRPVPDLPDHALADATAVIGSDLVDALSARPDHDLVDRALSEIRAALEATR